MGRCREDCTEETDGSWVVKDEKFARLCVMGEGKEGGGKRENPGALVSLQAFQEGRRLLGLYVERF